MGADSNADPQGLHFPIWSEGRGIPRDEWESVAVRKVKSATRTRTWRRCWKWRDGQNIAEQTRMTRWLVTGFVIDAHKHTKERSRGRFVGVIIVISSNGMWLASIIESRNGYRGTQWVLSADPQRGRNWTERGQVKLHSSTIITLLI